MTDGPGRPAGRRRTVRIGLTGPIGCGKSTIGRWLGELEGGGIDRRCRTHETVDASRPKGEAL